VRRYDLHCHSTRSDGLLTPAAVVERAAARGVDVLALTDHDEVSGIGEAAQAADALGVEFVAGSELSVSFEDRTVHVVGLNVDPDDAALNAGLESIRRGRGERAHRMGDALAAAGIPGAYEGALRFVTSGRMVSRTHFARFLVESGHSRTVKDVFRRYLAPGKPGYVPHVWATLGQAVGWIRGAGGQAVLAHPGRYDIGAGGMRRLLAQFRDEGGAALEVLSSAHTPAQYAEFAMHCRSYGFLASGGSDWHGPGESWMDLGDLPPLPAGLEPVWTRW
jgi:predicted metal-dependent phosphoesterase TrpH